MYEEEQKNECVCLFGEDEADDGTKIEKKSSAIREVNV